MLGWVAETTLVAAILALVALVIGRSRWVTAEARHALWVVVLIKFFLPPVFAWPRVEWERPAASPPVALVEPIVEPIPLPIVPDLTTTLDPPAEPVALTPVPEPAPVPELAPILAPAPPVVPDPRPAPPVLIETNPARSWVARFDWFRLVLAAWLVGSVAVAARGLARVIRFRRLLNQGSAGPAWLKVEVAELAARFGVRPPRVLVVPGVVSPLLWCLGRPRLVVPEGWDRLTPEARSSLIAHELAHLSRQDHWVVRLELVLSLAWWWNPVFRLARRRVRDVAELACDARVVRAFPDARISYAEALISVCEHQSRSVPPVPALGIGGPRAARTLEARLKMILRDPVRPPTRWALPLALVLIGLALPTWSQGRQDPVKAADPLVPPDAAQSDAPLPANPQPGTEIDPKATRTREEVALDPAPADPIALVPAPTGKERFASSIPVKVLQAQRTTQLAELARAEAMLDKVKLELKFIIRDFDAKNAGRDQVSLERANLKIAEAGVAREQVKLAEIDAQLDPEDAITPRSNPTVLQARRDAQAAEVARVEAERDRARLNTVHAAAMVMRGAATELDRDSAQLNLAAAEATVTREQARLAEADALLAEAAVPPPATVPAQPTPAPMPVPSGAGDAPTGLPAPSVAIFQARRDAQVAEIARVEAERNRAQVANDRNAALKKQGAGFVSKEVVQATQFNLDAADATVAREKARLVEADALLAQAKSAPTPARNDDAGMGPDSPRTLAGWRDQVEWDELQLRGKTNKISRLRDKVSLADRQLKRVKSLVARGAIEQGLEDQADGDLQAVQAELAAGEFEVEEAGLRLKQAKNRLEQEEAKVKREVEQIRPRLDSLKKTLMSDDSGPRFTKDDSQYRAYLDRYDDLKIQLDPNYKPEPEQAVGPAPTSGLEEMPR